MSAAALEEFLQLLVAGLTLGSVYGLMCVGLALIFGVMRVINFAQGDYMMLGMYFVLLFTGFVAAEGTAAAYYWALCAAVLAGVLFYGLGALSHKALIGRVTGTRVAQMEDEGHTPQLLLTLGISIVLQNLALMFFNSTPRAVRNPFSGSSWQWPVWGDEILVFVNQARSIAALIAVAIAVGLALVMQRTRLGRQLRAAADNSVASTYVGVNVNRAHRVAFGLGIALTTVAGATATTYHTFHPFTGLEFVIIMYAGVVLGGMGSIAGAFFGGLVIGLVQQLSTLVLPVQLQMTAIFVVFLLILVFRPQGFFGRQVERA
jgi:branched-chain amino acid transport system permease protein